MTDKEKEFTLEQARKQAAHKLMLDFVKDQAHEIAQVLEDLVPYLIDECGIDSLRSDLSIVNTTFAHIALEVIKANNNNEPLCLPADAGDMQSAVFEFTKFFRRLDSLERFLSSHREDPAFTMCIEAFTKEDIYG